MKKEIEIRARVSDEQKKQILKFFIENNIETKKSHQTDSYFCEKRLVESGKTDDRAYVLRVRVQDDSKKEIAYKEFSGESSWIEIESGIADADAVTQILHKLDQKEFLTIDKHRVSGRIGDIEINVDELRGVGDFVELEILSEDETAGKKQLTDFLTEKLSVKDAEIVDIGYVQLAEAAKK